MAGKPTDIDHVIKAVTTALNACELGDDEILVTIETASKPAKPTKAQETVEKALARDLPILKTQEERYVLGIVLEPLKEMGKTDSQHDTYSAAEVRAASHKFMEDFGVVGLQHQVNITGKVKVLENWICRDDCVIDGQPVTAGTWLMGFRVVDDGLWKRIKNGSLTGLSIGGIAQRMPLELTSN